MPLATLPDPAGWPASNTEVDIPALEDVEGSKPYHGWEIDYFDGSFAEAR